MFEELKALVVPILPYLLPFALWAAVGVVGTLLEALGTRFGVTALVALGQRLEAISVDGPKAWRGSRFTEATKPRALTLPPPPLAALAFIMLACSCAFLTSCAIFGGGGDSGGTTLEERRQRAQAAAHAIKHGVGVLKDSCLTYMAYRSVLFETVPEADEACHLFIEPPKVEPPPVLPEPSPPPLEPPAVEAAGGRLAFGS